MCKCSFYKINNIKILYFDKCINFQNFNFDCIGIDDGNIYFLMADSYWINGKSLLELIAEKEDKYGKT